MPKAGITAFGTYVPFYYMSRSTIGTAWGTKAAKGCRSFINSDEDSLTMAVEAARACIRYVGRADINGLYFASTTAPYAEKSHAVTAAAACDLKDQIRTADFMSSTKASTEALNAAFDAALAGEESILVTASDARDAYPKTSEEQMFGDGAAAVTVGTQNPALLLVDRYSVAGEIVDIWRNADDKYIRQAEGRFVKDEGYNAAMKKAVKGILEKNHLKPGDFKRIILTTPSAKDHISLCKKLGFDPETQLQDALMDRVGYTGCAQPLMLLAAAAMNAEPGDRVLLAAYGNGADAFILEFTEEIRTVAKTINLNMMLQSRREFKDYGRFLSFRGEVQPDPGAPYKIPPSTSRYWREQETFLRLHGSRCKKCGAVIFPINRVCYQCGAVDEYESYAFADQTARVFSFSIDKLAGRSDDPVVGQICCDTADGARVYLNMTDFDADEVQIGMEVEFTFRKIHNLGSFVNYYWRVRPVRREQGEI